MRERWIFRREENVRGESLLVFCPFPQPPLHHRCCCCFVSVDIICFSYRIMQFTTPNTPLAVSQRSKKLESWKRSRVWLVESRTRESGWVRLREQPPDAAMVLAGESMLRHRKLTVRVSGSGGGFLFPASEATWFA